jgi:hypothetical protein
MFLKLLPHVKQLSYNTSSVASYLVLNDPIDSGSSFTICKFYRNVHSIFHSREIFSTNIILCEEKENDDIKKYIHILIDNEYNDIRACFFTINDGSISKISPITNINLTKIVGFTRSLLNTNPEKDTRLTNEKLFTSLKDDAHLLDIVELEPVSVDITKAVEGI